MLIQIPEFDKVEAAFEVIPAGKYSVIVSNADIRPTKDASSKMIVWELTILGPTNNGRKLFLNNSLKKEALWNLKALLKAANAQFDASGFSTENVVGLKVDVTVEQEEYPKGSGVLKNRVNPPYSACSLM